MLDLYSFNLVINCVVAFHHCSILLHQRIASPGHSQQFIHSNLAEAESAAIAPHLPDCGERLPKRFDYGASNKGCCWVKTLLQALIRTLRQPYSVHIS
jgi:hypothetical protein